MSRRSTASAFACLLGSAAWPFVVGALAGLLMSPLDRAMQSAWCGVPFHSTYAVLGHCVACWVGSALLATTGLTLLLPGTAVYFRLGQPVRH